MSVPASIHPILMAEALVGGIFPATWVATPEGWCAAARLRPGQVVLTVGAGPLPLVAIEPQPPPLWVQVLPIGAVGNRGPLRLPPGQLLLVETEAALPITGEPCALIPAEALEGWRGIEAAPNAIAPLGLRLELPDLIYAGPGLILGVPGHPGRWSLSDRGTPLLPLAEARALVARLVAEDLGRALCQAAFGGAAGP